MKSFTIFVACFLHASVASVLLHHDHHMHPPPSSDHLNLRLKRDDNRVNRNVFESTSHFWRSEAQKKLRKQLEKKENTNKAKNVIMFLGDGMSISTITAARIYFGQKMGFTGEESVLSFEEFPHLGLSKVSDFQDKDELSSKQLCYSSDLLL